jgi:hypothetical protein
LLGALHELGGGASVQSLLIDDLDIAHDRADTVG